MNNSAKLQDRRVARNRQEERARAARAAQKLSRDEERGQLHLLAAEVAALMGGEARTPAAGDAWMFVDLRKNHEVSFYREGDQINIRGRLDGVRYALDIARGLSPAEIVKAINRKSTP
jgi:hypothetical protein